MQPGETSPFHPSSDSDLRLLCLLSFFSSLLFLIDELEEMDKITRMNHEMTLLRKELGACSAAFLGWETKTV